jgi:hypothetical protein
VVSDILDAGSGSSWTLHASHVVDSAQQVSRFPDGRTAIALIRSATSPRFDRADAPVPMIEGKMKSVHASFDRATVELRADGIRVAIFLSEIGRMLGLN